MIEEIKWKDLPTWFLGRNGTMKCGGIEVLPISGGDVCLSPLTSKGAVGRCAIVVERESLAELIEVLQKQLEAK